MSTGVDSRRKRRRRRRRNAMLLRIAVLAILILIPVGIITSIARKNPVLEQVTLEAGDPIELQSFFEDGKVKGTFVTVVEDIDTTKLGDYPIQIKAGRKVYQSMLTIQDTVAPTAVVLDATTEFKQEIVLEDYVQSITDATGVTYEYVQEPDVSIPGDAELKIVFTDKAGNQTIVMQKLHVIPDTIAPTITGMEDITAYIGDTISYRNGIEVADDKDISPTLTIDNSAVNLNAAGVYEVIYTATDWAGNTTSEYITVTLQEKPASYVEPEIVYAMAGEVLDSIVEDTMTKKEQAFAIYNWVKTHISYTGSSDKSSWTGAAAHAFEKRSGDCYNYYAAAKALFDCAGIENVDVVKSDTSRSSHFWSLINLGDGWYHVDCTPRTGEGDYFFMVTDEELEAYSSKHRNSHIFDKSLYPERATVSVQDTIDYARQKIRE